MAKRMSFSKTIPQMRDRSKTVTRRLGWWDLERDVPRVEPGDLIIAVEKAQGLRAGERQVAIGTIRVLEVHREPLNRVTEHELELEGFPGMKPADFFRLFGSHPDTMVTRIAFEHVEDGAA